MKNFQLYLGFFLVILLLGLSIFGQFLPFVDRDLEAQLFNRDEKGRLTAPPFAPNKEHIIGTDRQGRDLFSLLIMGAKETLYYLLVIVIVRYSIAIPLGTLAFWKKGIYKIILMTSNYVFSRIPSIFIVVLVINIPIFIFSYNRTAWIIILISLIEVGRVGDIIQNQLESNSHFQFIDSGIVSGISSFRLLHKYYFPFILPQLIVNFVIDLGRTMLLLGQLGIFSIFIAQEWVMKEKFIVELNLTSLAWPLLLKDVIRDIRLSPWIPFWATFAITYTILSFNLLGEGLRNYYLRKYQKL